MATHWIIVQGERWCVMRVSGNRTETFEVENEGQAVEIARTLRSQGYQGEAVLLGIESEGCLTSTVEPKLEEVRNDPRALSLAIENGLPWSVEEYVDDFIRSGSQFMGVALNWSEVAALVAELETHGVWVQSITPWSLVKLQQLVHEQPIGGKDFVLLAEEGEAVSLFAMRDGVPSIWEWTPTGLGEQLGQRMGLLQIRVEGENSRWWCVGLSEEQLTRVREWVGEDQLRIVNDEGLGCRQAGRILTCRQRPWVEWRRGPLEDRRPYRSLKTLMRVAAVMGLLAVGMLVVGLQMRAHRYESRAQQLNDEQVKLFRELMPGQKIPIGIRTRLESELVRLKAERGETAGEAKLNHASTTLERGLASLPPAVRMRVQSIEVDGDRIVWDCEVRTLADSATLVDAMTQGGFEVTAPRTEVVNGIVPLKLTTIRRQDASKSGEPSTPKGTP